MLSIVPFSTVPILEQIGYFVDSKFIKIVYIMECEAVASYSGENDSHSGILDDNLSPTDFTNSMKVAWALLEEEKLIISDPKYGIDNSARVIGEKLRDTIKLFFQEHTISTEEEIILIDENPDSSAYALVSEVILLFIFHLNLFLRSVDVNYGLEILCSVQKKMQMIQNFTPLILLIRQQITYH